MSALKQALGNDGAPHLFEHDGVSYEVSLITQEVETAFSEWLWGRARKVACDLYSALGDEKLTAELEKLGRLYLDGEFAFESATTAEALKTKAGVLKLCSLLWGCDEKEMVRLIVARGPEINTLLGVILAESGYEAATPAEREAQKEGGDPNPQAPGRGEGRLRRERKPSSQRS